jgi:hypothetical protein
MAEALGAIDIVGAIDIGAVLGAADGPLVAGAWLAPPPAQAAKVIAAAAVRMRGRNFTGRFSCRWARPRVHAITDRPLEAALVMG